MKEVSIIGVDLAKNVFQLPGAAADSTSARYPGPDVTNRTRKSPDVKLRQCEVPVAPG